MTALVSTFFASFALCVFMIVLKVREIERGSRSSILSFISSHLDPIVGRIIDSTKFIRGEFLGDIFRFLAAKIGLLTARALLSLRNFSSKLAAHLYHTSRKVESGDPATSHPSFFIKAILEFRDKMKEDKEKKN